MASASNSDDGSEIFWPGYVDAVTNLAINLLFVIALMAIVVITATLQISKMKPKDGGPGVVESQAKETTTTQESQEQAHHILLDAKKALQSLQSNPAQSQQAQQAMRQAELALDQSTQNQQRLAADLAKLEKKLQQVEKQAQTEQKLAAKAQDKSPPASVQNRAESDSDGGLNPDASQKSEVVQAKQRTRKPQQDKSEFQDLSAGGVVVVFAPDVIELSETETEELLRKINAGVSIKGSRWQLRVVSPKGFSEAARMAYYRLNTLRNVLIKNGAAPADIEMRVFEAEGPGANNARVLIRLMP